MRVLLHALIILQVHSRGHIHQQALPPSKEAETNKQRYAWFPSLSLSFSLVLTLSPPTT